MESNKTSAAVVICKLSLLFIAWAAIDYIKNVVVMPIILGEAAIAQMHNSTAMTAYFRMLRMYNTFEYIILFIVFIILMYKDFENLYHRFRRDNNEND